MSSTPAAGVTLAPDILSNVYISVKTTPKYYDSRLRILKKTWFQKVDKEKVYVQVAIQNLGGSRVLLEYRGGPAASSCQASCSVTL